MPVGQQSPRVTVVTSCFNAAQWLRESIESVLTQSYQQFEYLLVDDGSTDETWDILQNYKKLDRRIVILKKKNSGLADSLNYAIRRSRAGYIARLDSDDVAEPGRLQTQIAYLRRHDDVVLVGSGFTRINERGERSGLFKYPRGPPPTVPELGSPKAIFPALVSRFQPRRRRQRRSL